MTEFYVIMQKRQDGKVYADLHKTNQIIYLTKEDAEEDLKHDTYDSYRHIVKLIACLDEEIKELKEDKYRLEQLAWENIAGGDL
jgi:hypothetical protein